MEIGVVFPQTEIGPDVGAVRAYGQGVEELGFTATCSPTTTWSGPTPPCIRGGTAPTTWTPTSTSRSSCSATWPPAPRLELVTGIIILPQRQTALVAKQAAEVDLLTGGKVPAGRGARVESASSTRPWARTVLRRGARIEEQVDLLLRQLWTTRSVTMAGRFDRWSVPASHHCPSSVPSRSGSVAPRRGPMRGWGGWPTAGSPWSSPVPPSEEARAIVDAVGPGGQVGTPEPSAWRGESWAEQAVTWRLVERAVRRGRTVEWGGRHQTRSTPWGPAWPPWTPTSGLALVSEALGLTDLIGVGPPWPGQCGARRISPTTDRVRPDQGRPAPSRPPPDQLGLAQGPGHDLDPDREDRGGHGAAAR